MRHAVLCLNSLQRKTPTGRSPTRTVLRPRSSELGLNQISQLNTDRKFAPDRCDDILQMIVPIRVSDHPSSSQETSGRCNIFSIHFLSRHGHTFAMALPLINANGTGPYSLESLDSGRLSPNNQQWPSGTYTKNPQNSLLVLLKPIQPSKTRKRSKKIIPESFFPPYIPNPPASHQHA